MRPAYKRYLIAVPPPVLVVHLKRFQQTSKMPLMSFSHGLKKLDDNVSFPEYLDLMPFLAPRKEDYGLGKKKGKERGKDRDSRKVRAKEERCMYRLYAVVVHIGNMVSSGLNPFQEISDVMLIPALSPPPSLVLSLVSLVAIILLTQLFLLIQVRRPQLRRLLLPKIHRMGPLLQILLLPAQSPRRRRFRSQHRLNPPRRENDSGHISATLLCD
jgi:hypothetical protein